LFWCVGLMVGMRCSSALALLYRQSPSFGNPLLRLGQVMRDLVAMGHESPVSCTPGSRVRCPTSTSRFAAPPPWPVSIR
jgi:hypothetical protein